jgi:hypothetical protein
VTDVYAKFLPKPPPPWGKAILKAALVEAVLAAILFGCAYWPGFTGADNPLWFWLALLLQFPASLLFLTIEGSTTQIMPGVIVDSMFFVGTLVILLQFLLIAFLLRKPWRSIEPR